MSPLSRGGLERWFEWTCYYLILGRIQSDFSLNTSQLVPQTTVCVCVCEGRVSLAGPIRGRSGLHKSQLACSHFCFPLRENIFFGASTLSRCDTLVTSSSSCAPTTPLVLFLLTPFALMAADKGVVSTQEDGDEQIKHSNLCHYMHTDCGNIGSADRNLIATFQTTFTGNKRASQDWNYGPRCFFFCCCLCKTRQTAEFRNQVLKSFVFNFSHGDYGWGGMCRATTNSSMWCSLKAAGPTRCFYSLCFGFEQNQWNHKLNTLLESAIKILFKKRINDMHVYLFHEHNWLKQNSVYKNTPKFNFLSK